ncbi:MAG: efflux RND transporter periplasmic adaptor subunit [Stigonema ocellatum SAG 48.90 = DSM 106950]|nr:efflux RND transporter periplasmic adaptor subunit [Stigonema ocellatum SAG 48.90 = DSM 106950]
MDSQDHQPVRMDSQEQKSSSPQPAPLKRNEQGHNGRGPIVAIALGTGFFVTLLAIGILPRLSQQQELKAAAKEQSIVPSVNVITPQRGKASDLVLSGSVVSLNQTSIYARSNGYLRRWLVDIGDRVKQGQLLAEIESPDVDQEVLQARAQLAQAQANLIQSRAALAKGRSDLKQTRANLLIALQTWQRWKILVQQGAVTQQDADTKYATYQANLANVEAAQNTVNSNEANVNAAQALVNSNIANLQRYTVLQSYEKVTAPFTGIITARNVNAGVLITPGTGNTNTSLYTIAGYDNVTVNVNVPQTLTQSLKIGQTAQITVRELPQRVFSGKVVRTSDALDPNTRTLLAQVAVQNLDGALRPGMYGSVKFNIARANPPLIVPASTLVINAAGTQVATVTKDNKVHYQKVVLGRDYGTEIEIASGLTGNESLLATPTVDQIEGTPVKPVAAAQKTT